MLSAVAFEQRGCSSPERVYDDYLIKPVDLRQLLEKFHALLNIEWIYDRARVPAGTCTAWTSRCPRHDIDELIGLGQIGYVRGINAKLARSRAARRNAAFVGTCGRRETFDLRRFMAMLEAIRSRHAWRTREIVLVVDDSPDTLRMLTDALEEAGMTVLVALEGAQALAMVTRFTPDVILMDAVMPGMDGFETCRASSTTRCSRMCR